MVRLDLVQDLYPGPRLPDGGDHRVQARVAASLDTSERLSVELGNAEAVSVATAPIAQAERRDAIAGLIAPRYASSVIAVPYGETVEWQATVGLGWVLTGITLLPAILADGTVGVPLPLRITGFDFYTRLYFPFAATATLVTLALDGAGTRLLRLSHTTPEPSGGGVLQYPTAILRWENWFGGKPLEGGNL